MQKRAFYTGALGRPGHYFWLNPHRSFLYREEIMAAIPDFIDVWCNLWDGGFLKNGNRSDIYDGKVWSIPARGPWIAFVWWDRSIDKRPGSNSCFFVSGFEWRDTPVAFDFAKKEWIGVVARQQHPLVLQ